MLARLGLILADSKHHERDELPCSRPCLCKVFSSVCVCVCVLHILCVYCMHVSVETWIFVDILASAIHFLVFLTIFC